MVNELLALHDGSSYWKQGISEEAQASLSLIEIDKIKADNKKMLGEIRSILQTKHRLSDPETEIERPTDLAYVYDNRLNRF